jgi:ferredoxin
VKLSVDSARCMGHGRCYAVAPELLDCDDEGYVTVRGSAIDVPADQADAARDAAANCPESAIDVTEE